MNKICEYCEKSFIGYDRRARFCCRSCSATYNNIVPDSISVTD